MQATITVPSPVPQGAAGTDNLVELNWTYHVRQTQALDVLALDVPELCLLYGGAKGGGKSVLGCRWMLTEALKLIDDFGLLPSNEPLAIGFIGRNRATDFEKTTLETWKREIPSALYRINERKHEIVIAETVKYFYGGFDNREDIEKFNSAEYCRNFVDQAEECDPEPMGFLRATLRLKINGQIPVYRMLLTANPAQCWLKQEYVKCPPGQNGNYFIPALPSDNPYLPPTYMTTLRNSFTHRPEMLAAYIEGSWDAITGTDVIILDRWVEASHSQRFIGKILHKFIAADIARFGDDRTVIQYMEETDIIEKEIYGQRDASWTAGKLAEMARRHLLEDGSTPTIVIDADGLGGPIADFLKHWGFETYEIHSAAAAADPKRFYNRRAEMWWTAGESFANGEIMLTRREGDSTLYRELSVPRYDFRDGRILVESKEEIKKSARYGQSTDEADAYIYGLWARKFVRTPALKHRENREEQSALASPMAL